MRLKFSLLILTLLLFGLNSFAQSFENELGFKSDNDAYLFYGQDRYYTNGLFLYFRHATKQHRLGEKMEKLTYEVSAGQKMYNPISGYRPDPTTQDRPFAGYLYAAANINLFYNDEKIIKAGLEVGVVGPEALGQETQELLHRTVGFYKIEGWKYQIANELALNFSAQYTQLLLRSSKSNLDLSLETYVNLGSTFSGAGVGILLRTGDLNQLFNSAYTNAVVSNGSTTARFVNNEFFFYAKPQVNFVAYDATMQGSMFENVSPVTFKPEPLVFAQQLGVNYTNRRFTFDFGLMFKSKEVKSTARRHQYGTIAMYYRFGKSSL